MGGENKINLDCHENESFFIVLFKEQGFVVIENTQLKLILNLPFFSFSYLLKNIWEQIKLESVGV